MKGYSGLYYLFFVLLIMGGFAAMAQNQYGLYILAVVGILYGLLFIYQCFSILLKYEPSKRYLALEPGCLAILSFLITMRVFYIRLPFVEEVFGLVVLLLIGLYVSRMIHFIKIYQNKNFRIALLLPLFYFTIILYLVSMISFAFLPGLSVGAGIAAFTLLILLFVVGLVSGKMLIEGQQQSFFRSVLHLKDNSLFVISIFFLFTIYAGLTRTGVLPKLYSDEYPQAYFDLINKDESGKADKTKDQNYQDYKKKYEQFVKRQIGKSAE